MFTVDELRVLIEICDIATKARGLQVAQAATAIAGKAQLLISEKQKEQVKQDEE